MAGQTFQITVAGNNFFETNPCDLTSNVALSANVGTADLSNIVVVSLAEFTATVTLSADVPAQTADLQVGCVDYMCGDEVNTPVQIVSGLTITSVTPAAWWAGQKKDITITGTNFLTKSDTGGPSQVTLTDGANDVTLSDVKVLSSTQITATVDVTKKAPAETVTLTVTNPSTNGTPETATASPAPVVLPVPVIQWLGKKISGDDAKNQSVKVGQPVELTTIPATLPGGFTVSKSTWDIDGTTIKQPHEDDDSGFSVDETDLNTQNTTFYWLYPDTGLNVTYDYCATDPNQNQLCTSPQAQATFKATEPNISLTTTEPYGKGKVNELAVCGQKAKEADMFYGDLNYPPGKCLPPYVGPPGINLTASGASGGKYVFVQVIQSDTLTWNGPTPHSCGPYQMVLDGFYPFPGVNPNAPSIAYDGPGMSLPNKYTSGKRDFDAIMYLLWQPPQLSGTGTASIAVPIGHQEWHFVATTDQKQPIGSGKWEKPDTTAHGDNGVYQASQATDNDQDGYPSWSGASEISSCNPE